MKTISGSVVSSKPISLSKAASIISSFISIDTGAPGALSVYLQRTSDVFNELVQIHKDLKSARSSDRKHKKSRLETTVENGNLIDAEENHREDEVAAASERDRTPGLGQEQSFRYSGNSELGSIDDQGRKIEKMKKKKMKSNVSECDHEVVERESARDEVEKSKERKKRKKEEAEDGGFDDSEERHRMKKKKRKHEIQH